MSPEEALARCLRHQRGGAATDAAGHEDAEDADELLTLAARFGFALVPVRPPPALQAAAWPAYPAGGPSQQVALADWTAMVTAARLYPEAQYHAAPEEGAKENAA